MKKRVLHIFLPFALLNCIIGMCCAKCCKVFAVSTHALVSGLKIDEAFHSFVYGGGMRRSTACSFRKRKKILIIRLYSSNAWTTTKKIKRISNSRTQFVKNIKKLSRLKYLGYYATIDL